MESKTSKFENPLFIRRQIITMQLLMSKITEEEDIKACRLLIDLMEDDYFEKTGSRITHHWNNSNK